MKICKRGHEREDSLTRCKLCAVIKMSEYRENKKKHLKLQKKKYREGNKEILLSKARLYYNKNKESIKVRHRIYKNEKRKTCLIFKLKHNLRSRLQSAIKHGYKKGSAVRDLGCSIEELKVYLELKFEPGMTWDNYGNKKDHWSIDHIIPIANVDLTIREDVLKVCHYTNLQPMWTLDNIKKGNRVKE